MIASTPSSSLTDIGIDTVTDITFTLRVYPADDITEEDLLNQVCTIYPLGKDAVVPYIRETVDGEIVLFDNEYATMVIEGSKEDTLWGYSKSGPGKDKYGSMVKVATVKYIEVEKTGELLNFDLTPAQ